jgi:hypothetical protein
MAFKNNKNDVILKKVAFTSKVMILYYLGVFWIMDHYTVLHFALLDVANGNFKATWKA